MALLGGALEGLPDIGVPHTICFRGSVSTAKMGRSTAVEVLEMVSSTLERGANGRENDCGDGLCARSR